MNNYFESGAHLDNPLAAYGMGKKEEPAGAPNSMLENVNGQPKPPEVKPVPVALDLDGAHTAILEAVSASARSDDLADAAEAVFEWADSDDHSYDNLDGYAQSMAGIDDDEDEPTDEQLETYWDVLGDMANLFAAMGVDDETISTMFDEEDDSIADSLAQQVAGLDEDDRDELATAYSFSDNDEMTEALKKVIRQGKVKLIKKKFKKRRRTAAQKMALKKARRKANTGRAKVKRKKSMKIRAKRIGN